MADYLRGQRGLLGVVGGLVGIISFGANLLFVFGGTPARILAVGVGVTAAMAFLIVAVGVSGEASRRRIRSEKLLQRYCQSITAGSASPPWRIISWENLVKISRKGDTTEQITVKFEVTRKEFLFFRLSNGCGWPQPERYRRRVRVEASSITVTDGHGGDSWHLTSAWKSDGKLEVLAHCRDAVAVGSVVSVRLYYSWPRKCSPLVAGSGDSFRLKFREGLEYLDYTVIMPDGRQVECQPLNEPAAVYGVVTQSKIGRRNSEQIRLEVREVPPGAPVGMTLTVKGAGRE